MDRIGQLTNDEKYCPRVQGGKLLPDLRALMDGSFYVHDNKDVKDVYLYFSKAFTKLNLTKYDTLEVDTVIAKNLFASKFTLRQTTFQNGDLMVSDGGIVDAVNGLELTFKDQSGFNVCAFAVGDLIEAHSVRADNSLAITNPQGTVTQVVGNKVTITYYSTSAFKKGDEVYRVGNTTDATRRDSLYFSTNRTNTPYFDVYDNIDSFDTVGSPTTAWTSAVPKVRIGNLAGITDADFGGALSGYGIYTQKGYFKGDIKITNQGSISIAGFNNDAGFITSGDIPPIPQSFYQSTEPTGMITGDFWFNTTAGVMRMKRYNGTSWGTSPYVSVYMDANGLYAGSITAGQITAGTLTGFTIQTAASAPRIVLNTSTLTAYGHASDVNTLTIGYGGGKPYINFVETGVDYGTLSTGLYAVSPTAVNTMIGSSGGFGVSGTLSANAIYAVSSMQLNGYPVATQSWVGSQGYITSSYAHFTNTSNPHSVTAAQVGAEVPLTFSSPLSRSVNTISIAANGITSTYTSGQSGTFAIGNIISITVTNGLVTSITLQ